MNPAFAVQIATLCAEHGASVTSWIRTPARNKQVGGMPTSQHLQGNAVDLVLDDPLQTSKLIARAQRMGLTAIHETDHIHIQLRRKS